MLQDSGIRINYEWWMGCLERLLIRSLTLQLKLRDPRSASQSSDTSYVAAKAVNCEHTREEDAGLVALTSPCTSDVDEIDELAVLLESTDVDELRG